MKLTVAGSMAVATWKPAMWVLGRASSQTVCQMPELGVYQPTCLPVGRLGSVGSNARTTKTFSPSRLNGIGDVGLERGVTPLVLGDLPTVDPHVGPPVDRAEPEPDPLIGGKFLGDCELAAIPADLRRILDLVNARELALPRERDHDRAVVTGRVGFFPAFSRALVLGVEPKLPAAIEVGPEWPHGVGPGMLGLGDGRLVSRDQYAPMPTGRVPTIQKSRES